MQSQDLIVLLVYGSQSNIQRGNRIAVDWPIPSLPQDPSYSKPAVLTAFIALL